MKKRIFAICLLTSFFSTGFGQVYEPGVTYYGTGNYVEYIAGNLPVILSAPHGGDLNPSTIPDRSCAECVTVNDAYTQELVREIYDALFRKTGCHAHVVINRLSRKKLDANRDLEEAADGNNEAAIFLV